MEWKDIKCAPDHGKKMEWKDIKCAPDHGKQILVGFQGQFDWFSYVTNAHGVNTGKHSGNALPTHWTDIIVPILK